MTEFNETDRVHQRKDLSNITFSSTRMGSDQPNVALVHNVISPYRSDLFEELSEQVDLRVYFCFEEESNRLWETSLADYSFDARILKHLSVGPFVLNYLLPVRLWRRDADVYMAVDTFATIFTTFLTLLIAKIRDRPFVLWSGVIHTPYTYERLPELLHSSTHPYLSRVGVPILEYFENRYRSFLYENADSFVAYSDKAHQYLVDRGVDPDDIFTGGQVMPRSQLPSPSEEATSESNDEETVILSLGYLRDVKGLDFLIEAFSNLEHEDVKLLIAGDGNERDELEKLAAGDDRISFVGYVEDEEKADYYARSDVFVLPTLHDPWGLVVNEAMYYELPVVTTHAAASADHLVHDNGLIVPPMDPHALEVALRVLIDNDELRAEMARNSKQIITQYNSVSQGVQPFVESIRHVTPR